MTIRDRIQELRRVRASDLAPHPQNWRLHPQRQRSAMRGVLAEIGYADALIARELDDGSLHLIDGHLRAETTPDAIVPVLVVDLNDDEANKLLATHDPLAAMATTDGDRLAELLAEAETESAPLAKLLDDLAQTASETSVGDPADVDEIAIPESYELVVACRDEADQQALYERLTEEGRRCRVLML